MKFFWALVILILSAIAWYVIYAALVGVPSNFIFDYKVAIEITRGAAKWSTQAFGSLLIVLSIPLAIIAVKNAGKHKQRFGDARWATLNELRKYGYFAETGVILGKVGNKHLMSFGPKTIGLAARPRSGKGVSFVVPNLLNWPGSAVVIDVKKELFDITSKFRHSHGHEIIAFDPMNPEGKSHCINVFDFIDKTPVNLAAEVQKLAYGLIKQHPKDDFWNAGARKIFMGIAMAQLEIEYHEQQAKGYSFYQTTCSIASIIDFTEKDNLQDSMAELLSQHSDELSPATQTYLRDYSEMEPDSKLVSGYLETFTTCFQVYKSSQVKAAVSKTSIDFADIKRSKKTLYLIMRPEDLAVLGTLMGVIVDRVINQITKDIRQEEKGSVLFMLDEFTALGEMSSLKKAAAFLGGYGARICIIYQNFAQLETVYGRDGARELRALMHERIHFASSDVEEAKMVSTEIGQQTVRSTSRSINKGGRGRSISEAGKDLMSPAELLRLNEEKEIILSAGQRPILADKIFYYKDKIFKKRLSGSLDTIPRLDVSAYDPNADVISPESSEKTEKSDIPMDLDDFDSDDMDFT